MNRTRSRLQRLRQVGPAGAALLFRTLLLLLAARLALRWVPVKKVIAWKQRAISKPAPEDPSAKLARVRWAILAVARNSPLEFVCFPQCLAAAELLRQSGIRSRLHYGVTREGAKLMTHTWLEAAGTIVIGGEVADAFSTLDIY